MDQPVQDDGSPSGLEEADQRVLPATPPEREEADIERMDRHERGVQPPRRRLRGHDKNARGRGHPRQPGNVDHDRGHRDAQSGSAELQAPITRRRVLIGREVLVYLAEQGQLDVDAFNFLGFWNRRGTDSVCPTTSTVTSPAEMPYSTFIARLYHGIEATTCQAQRFFSALAHFIGDLRSRMLASKVECMMFFRLIRQLIGEVRESDAAVAQARVRVAQSPKVSVSAQEERSNMSVDLTV